MNSCLPPRDGQQRDLRKNDFPTEIQPYSAGVKMHIDFDTRKGFQTYFGRSGILPPFDLQGIPASVFPGVAQFGLNAQELVVLGDPV